MLDLLLLIIIRLNTLQSVSCRRVTTPRGIRRNLCLRVIITDVETLIPISVSTDGQLFREYRDMCIGHLELIQVVFSFMSQLLTSLLIEYLQSILLLLLLLVQTLLSLDWLLLLGRRRLVFISHSQQGSAPLHSLLGLWLLLFLFLNIRCDCQWFVATLFQRRFREFTIRSNC